jgi:hypothetical protein
MQSLLTFDPHSGLYQRYAGAPVGFPIDAATTFVTKADEAKCSLRASGFIYAQRANPDSDERGRDGLPFTRCDRLALEEENEGLHAEKD